MARPQALQYLKHGKALCGSVFRLFVETWNYIVKRADGIVGDRDVNADEGCIYVDNSTPERPVIRLDRSKLLEGGGGGSIIDGTCPAAYDIETDGDSVDANGGENGGELQIAHFNDDERDSGKGLASRLSVKDGSIVAEDDGLMLVARKDGKVIYIPMSGEGEDPDASGEGDSSDPCDHPGDKGNAGGVAADADDEHSAGGVAGGGDGGVGAEGGTHPGDDNCNCD